METRKHYLKAFGLLRALRKAQHLGDKDAVAMIAARLGDMPGNKLSFDAAIYATFCPWGHRATPLAVEIINAEEHKDLIERKSLPRAELIRAYIRASQHRARNRALGSSYCLYTRFNEWKPELKIMCAEHNARLTASLTPEEIAQREAALPPISEIDPDYAADRHALYANDIKTHVMNDCFAITQEAEIHAAEYERHQLGGDYYNEGDA